MRRFIMIFSLAAAILLLGNDESLAQRGGHGGGGGGHSGGGGTRSGGGGGAMRPTNVGHASPAVGSYGGSSYHASRPVIGPSTYHAPAATQFRPSVAPSAGRAFAPATASRATTVSPRSGTAFTPQGTGHTAFAPGGVAIGPYGGHSFGAARTGNGTYYASGDRMHETGENVRNGFRYRNAFNDGWFGGYPGSWFLPGWNGGQYWNNPGYSDLAAFGGYPLTPSYFDYGSNVVADGPNVFINGDLAGTMAQYSQQATDLAEAGAAAAAPTDAAQWTALGVFAMVTDGESKSSNIFELAVSKEGLIRGNYYNALTDTNEPIQGSVDKKTQRAAWTVGSRKTPVYEAGLANLTKNETTMMVHYGPDKTQQYTLVRISPAG